MSYAKENNIQPKAELYVFTQEEIDELVKAFVKEKVGIDLDLSVGCLDEAYDMYVRWEIEDDEEYNNGLVPEMEKAVEELGLHPEEDFMNRDHLFQAIFDADIIGYHFDEEENLYELSVYIHKTEGDQ